MSFILIDRRKAGRGKSSPNRQKLIKRVKNFIKSSSPQNIGRLGGVTGTSGPAGGGTSPVKVAGAALDEPSFSYARDGEHTSVIIGNKEYDRGDKIDIPSQDESKGRGGPGDGGEDDFIITIARDEFLDYFFEDCELPNLTNEKYTDKLDNKYQQAGFSTTGSPAQLSIMRTYKQSLGRCEAMVSPLIDELEQLEKTRAAFQKDLDNEKDEEARKALSLVIAKLDDQIFKLKQEIESLSGFDKTDLRYRKREAKPLKTVEAVIFFLMDISGSMDENKKTIARRWFALNYAFIKRRYGSTELVFIAHTDEAFEMSEADFFSTRVNGGTVASKAIEMTNKIIRERFDPNQTNIYVYHASDGDNWVDDNATVVDEMCGDGNLMAKIQFFSYVEVGQNSGGMGGWFGVTTSSSREDSNLWQSYQKVRESSNINAKKLIASLIETADDCYPVFKKVFKKVK